MNNSNSELIRKTLRKFYQTRGMRSIPQHCASRSFGFRTNSGGVCSLPAFIGVMLAVTHRHVCLRAYVDAPSRGATRGVHLRFVLQNLPLYFSSYPKNLIFNTYFMNSLSSSRLCGAAFIHRIKRGIAL